MQKTKGVGNCPPTTFRKELKPVDESLDVKHLDMVQSAINRMAGNSFILKGWTITLTAALFDLAAKDAQRWVIVIAFFPAIAFWGLDAFYLELERRFRRMHEEVAKKLRGEPSTIILFEMTTKRYGNGAKGWGQALFSRSVLPFHGIVVGLILLVTLGFRWLQTILR